jgi:putative 4-mercaptohistidine N1-methyltranferase
MSPTPITTAYRVRVIVLLMLAYTSGYIDRYALTILMPDVERSFGVGDTVMGFLVGPAFALFFTLAGIPVARLADRYSRARILAIGCVLWSLFTVLSGLARDVTEFAIARIGVGLGEAACLAPAYSLIADTFPKGRRSLAVGFFNQSVYIGQIAGLWWGGAMAAARGWRDTYFAIGVPGLVVAPLLWWAIREPMRHVPANRRERCLDVGCSVGRSALEFARFFSHVDAIDFSARFIQSGVRLQQGDEVLYEIPTEGELTVGRAISLDRIGLADVGHRVNFMQGDACNLKDLFTDYDLVFAGNLVDRLYDPALFLDTIAGRLRPDGMLVITSPYTWLEEYTQKAKWVGGRREAGEPLTTFAGLSRAFAGRFELLHRQDVPFVIRETARKHQHTLAEMTVWRRIGG